jgi:hypothetical protein
MGVGSFASGYGGCETLDAAINSTPAGRGAFDQTGPLIQSTPEA